MAVEWRMIRSTLQTLGAAFLPVYKGGLVAFRQVAMQRYIRQAMYNNFVGNLQALHVSQKHGCSIGKDTAGGPACHTGLQQGLVSSNRLLHQILHHQLCFRHRHHHTSLQVLGTVLSTCPRTCFEAQDLCDQRMFDTGRLFVQDRPVSSTPVCGVLSI